MGVTAQGAPTTATADVTAQPAADEAESELPDVSGTWVMLHRTSTFADMAVIGGIRSTTDAVVLYRLDQDGDRVRARGEFCAITIDDDSRMISSRLPRRFIDALDPPAISLRLSREGDRIRVRQSRNYVVVGMELENPRTDPLPTSPDDPRVVDEDRDGHPGVTVEVRGIIDGEIYTGQRSWDSLDGYLVTPDRFEGSVDFSQEQVVFDASRRLLRNGPDPEAEPERSDFKLIRVPDSTTCAAAIALSAAER